MPFPGTQQIPIQFSGGLNSQFDDLALDQPYLETLRNGVFNKIGRIDKRNGLTAISSAIQGGGNISRGAQLTTFDDELLLLDGEQLFSYQPEEQVWISRGATFATTNLQQRVINTKAATQANPDATSAQNLTLYCWEDNRTSPARQNGVRYSVVNNQTGTMVVSDQFLYFAGSRPKCVTDGTTFHLYYVAADDTILSATIPVARPSTVTSNLPFVARDGYASTPGTQTIPYDAAIYQGAPIVAYASQDGIRVAPDGYVVEAATAINAIGIACDSKNQVWISYSDDTDTFVGCWRRDSGHWSTVLAPIRLNTLVPQLSVAIGLCEDNSRGSVNLVTEVALSGNNNFVNNYTVSPKGVSTFIGQSRSVGLASKPFRHGGNIFVNTVAQSALQSTYFTQCLTAGARFASAIAAEQAANASALATSFAIVSKHAPQTGGQYRSNSLLSQADSTGPQSFVFAGQRKGAFTSYQNAQTVNLGVAGYGVAFDQPGSLSSVSANRNLHIAGGVKKIYDGISCVEDNFHLFPEGADGKGCTIQLTSGGALPYDSDAAPNQLQYLVVYEWADNSGQVQRSTPSVAATIQTTSAGQAAILTGPTLRLTEKVADRSPVIISIYRTQSNLSIFYKITNDNAPIVNDTTVDQWTFIDTQNDTEIAANENLYTGSQLPNTGPPACSLISLYQQRLLINSTEDDDVLWFSQNKFDQTQYNTLALDWNTSFVQGIDSRLGNSITAIGLLDSSVAIFKDSAIFILQGDGPNANDTSGQFTDAQLLASDVGCSNQSSLCFITQTPDTSGGLLFQSAKGIYLLGRDQSVSYIGAPVEQYNALTITAAVLLSDSDQVVFTTAEGTALVYNYYFNAWSTWETLPAVSACVWRGQLCILSSRGAVMIQDDSWIDTFPDGVSYPVRLQITTPWIKLSGLQGYGSCYSATLLGQFRAPHILQVGVAYDYNASNAGNVSINSALAANRWGGLPAWGSLGSWGDGALFANYQFTIAMLQPRCTAIKLTIQDSSASGSEGFSLNGLVLECRIQSGGPRLPTSNTTGIR